MSADTWIDCPCCGEYVGIYYLFDFVLNKDGTITHAAEGSCDKCETKFK